MLKLIGSVLKAAVFSVVVLVLGNWITWDGRTVSDHVKRQMATFDLNHLTGSVKDWAEQLTSDAKKGFRKKANQLDDEEISVSEKQKLKALIHELNSSKN